MHQRGTITLGWRKATKSWWVWPFLSVGRFSRRKPLGALGVAIVALTTIVTLSAPVIAPQDPFDINIDIALQSPSAVYLFGTDALGRDVLSRTMYAAKISLYVGLTAMIFQSTIGLALGVASAYYGGAFDLILQRVVDGVAALPALVLALALVAVLPPSVNNVVLAITIVGIPRMTRVIRSAALSIKQIAYIEAARAIGAGNARIMFRHIMPNTFPPLIIVATTAIGGIIITESSLSFLGVGVPHKVLSWGGMLSGDTREMFASAPWMGLGPGFALTALVFGLNMFGDALRDVLDPKLRGR